MSQSSSDVRRIPLGSVGPLDSGLAWTESEGVDEIWTLVGGQMLDESVPALIALIDSLADEHLHVQQQRLAGVRLDLLVTPTVRIHSLLDDGAALIEISAGLLAQLVDICLKSSLLIAGGVAMDGFPYPMDGALLEGPSQHSRELVRGLTWARSATLLAYYHEMGHILLGHVAYVGEATAAPGRMDGLNESLISAQQAFEFEADKLALRHLLFARATPADRQRGAHLGSTLSLLGFSLHVVSEVIARLDFGLDPVALFRSHRGLVEHDRVHPGIAQRRFQAISQFFQIAETSDIGRAAEAAFAFGAGLAARCVAVLYEDAGINGVTPSDALGISLAGAKETVSDYYSYTLELDGRLAWLRRRGALEQINDYERIAIRAGRADE